MRRQAVIQRLAFIESLCAIIQAYRKTLTVELARRPAAPSVESFGYGPVFDHLHAELATLESQLGAAETAYVFAKVRLADVRRLFNRAAAKLHRLQSDTRRLLEGLLGSCVELEVAEIQGATPQDPVDLVRHVERTLELLRYLEEHPVPLLVPWATIDAGALAAELQGGFETFETSRVHLEEASPIAAEAQGRADEAIAEVDRIVPWIGRCLESFCHLAGKQGLAGRIRKR